MDSEAATEIIPHRGRTAEVFAAFLKLGLTSFGGPIAHLGYFRDEFVTRRRWLDEPAYADLVALCQFLPGPASSQVGMAIGLSRAGFAGALAAWAAFTAPSALALVIFAHGLPGLEHLLGTGWLHGLKTAAVAVVALAVLGMARSLAPDRVRATFAVIAAVIALAFPTAAGQIAAIVAGGLAGLVLLRGHVTDSHVSLPLAVPHLVAVTALVTFFTLLVGLPFAASATGDHGVALVDAFYRAGSLVFGGGHVVLPLLQAEVVPAGLGRQRRVPRGLRRGAGGPRPAVHVCRLSRRRDGPRAQRLDRRAPVSAHDLHAVVPARRWRAAVLGNAETPAAGPGGAQGRQRGGGRAAAGGALSAGVDRRHHERCGFRDCDLCVPAPFHVADAAMAGRDAQRRRRRGRGLPLSGRLG